MSSKSHMQELQLEKEKVNEVRVDESFDKKVIQKARQKKILCSLKKSQLLKAVKTCNRLYIFFQLSFPNPIPDLVYILLLFLVCLSCQMEEMLEQQRREQV